MAIRANEVAVQGWNEPDEAYVVMKDALMAIGRVTDQDQRERLLLGTARYGVHRVHVEVSVTQLGQGSEVRIRAQGDTLLGRGRAAKSVARRLVELAESGIPQTWR